MSQFRVRPVEWVDLMLWSASLGDAWRQADRAQRMGKGRSRAAARRRAIRQAAWDSLKHRWQS